MKGLKNSKVLYKAVYTPEYTVALINEFLAGQGAAIDKQNERRIKSQINVDEYTSIINIEEEDNVSEYYDDHQSNYTKIDEHGNRVIDDEDTYTKYDPDGVEIHEEHDNNLQDDVEVPLDQLHAPESMLDTEVENEVQTDIQDDLQIDIQDDLQIDIQIDIQEDIQKENSAVEEIKPLTKDISDEELYSRVNAAYNLLLGKDGKSGASPKKSTLKKRKAEYAEKYAKMQAMKAVYDKQQSYENKKNEYLQDLNKRGMVKLNSNNDIPHDAYEAADLVMYFDRIKGMTSKEKDDLFSVMTFDVSKLSKDEMSTKSQDKQEWLKGMFKSKVAGYEKVFADVLKWNPNDFVFSTNKDLSADQGLSEKMSRLGIIPIVLNYLSEYKQLISDGILGKDSEAEFNDIPVIDEEIIDELEVKASYFEQVRLQYQGRIEMMQNPYYLLMGKTAIGQLKDEDLWAHLGNTNDPELVKYCEGLLKMRSAKINGFDPGKTAASKVISSIWKEKAKKAKQLDPGSNRFVQSKNRQAYLEKMNAFILNSESFRDEESERRILAAELSGDVSSYYIRGEQSANIRYYRWIYNTEGEKIEREYALDRINETIECQKGVTDQSADMFEMLVVNSKNDTKSSTVAELQKRLQKDMSAYAQKRRSEFIYAGAGVSRNKTGKRHISEYVDKAIIRVLQNWLPYYETIGKKGEGAKLYESLINGDSNTLKYLKEMMITIQNSDPSEFEYGKRKKFTDNIMKKYEKLKALASGEDISYLFRSYKDGSMLGKEMKDISYSRMMTKNRVYKELLADYENRIKILQSPYYDSSDENKESKAIVKNSTTKALDDYLIALEERKKLSKTFNNQNIGSYEKEIQAQNDKTEKKYAVKSLEPVWNELKEYVKNSKKKGDDFDSGLRTIITGWITKDVEKTLARSESSHKKLFSEMPVMNSFANGLSARDYINKELWLLKFVEKLKNKGGADNNTHAKELKEKIDSLKTFKEGFVRQSRVDSWLENLQMYVNLNNYGSDDDGKLLNKISKAFNAKDTDSLGYLNEYINKHQDIMDYHINQMGKMLEHQEKPSDKYDNRLNLNIELAECKINDKNNRLLSKKDKTWNDAEEYCNKFTDIYKGSGIANFKKKANSVGTVYIYPYMGLEVFAKKDFSQLDGDAGLGFVKDMDLIVPMVVKIDGYRQYYNQNYLDMDPVVRNEYLTWLEAREKLLIGDIDKVAKEYNVLEEVKKAREENNKYEERIGWG